jgi:hypothetical protein
MPALLILLMFTSTFISAKTIEDVDFPDTITQDGQKLVLNGVGLRVKHKWGMDFRVYVAGFYVTSKTNDTEKLITGTDLAVLDMDFLRSLDKETVQDAWKEAFDRNCRFECERKDDQLKKFNEWVGSVKSGQHFKIFFVKDGVGIEGAGLVKDLALRRNVMASFFGKFPASEDLKKSLLGG